MKDPITKTGDKLNINIFRKQAEFLNSPCDDVLFGGAAGAGKGWSLLLFSAKRRAEIPNSTGILFRRTYPELEKSLIRKSRDIFPYFGAKYKEAKKIWEFPNGSIQEFGYCERDGDVYIYQSAEYEDMCFDELTHMTEFQFSYLTSRVRTSKTGVQTMIRSATNPGNIGHQWVYKRYIEPWQVHKIWRDKVTGKSMTFIPARIQDNPALMEADPGYLLRLNELPEKKRLALKEGRWDVFEGAYFPEWNPAIGITRGPFKPERGSILFLGLDWGYADPASVGWYCLTPYGRVYRYRELYITQHSPKQLAKRILEMSPKEEQYEYMMASPEIWGKKTELESGGEPIQKLMQQVFGERIRMRKANNARVPGWLKMREYLQPAPDGYPWFMVSPDCTNFIRTIPSCIHSEVRPEDMSGDCEDHVMEETRYALVSLGDVPLNIITPYESNYERIFGRRIAAPELMTQGPMPRNRGGY